MLVTFEAYSPSVSKCAFVAPTAVLIGNVIVHDDASIWYGAVLRADHGEQAIVVGPRSSVQDNCVIHVALDRGTTIGSDVTVGHGAILEGCEIGDGAVIGMNSTILDHARIGARSLVAAGSLVLPSSAIPPGVLAAGVPAEVKKPVSGATAWWIEHSAGHYVELARRYREHGLDTSGQEMN
ncbi:MAG TPA: gamma carbonic anhydrase family protein [Chloroflexota bacterium]